MAFRGLASLRSLKSIVSVAHIADAGGVTAFKSSASSLLDSCGKGHIPYICSLLKNSACHVSSVPSLLHMATLTEPPTQNGSIATSNGNINLAYAGMKATLPSDVKVVFVLGGPGSGKGTQCAKLVKDFDIAHLSAGDLLRAHMTSGSPEGQMVADMIKQGQIVPSHVTISLLEKAMLASGRSLFLIDGFPRNEENRAAFEKQTGIEPQFVLFFDCPEDVLERRLLGRNEGRTDDNIETIRKRFKVFMDSSLPVIQYYEAKGKVRRIDADRPIDLVYRDVEVLFEPLVAKALAPAL